MDTCTTSSIQDIRCIIYEALSKPLDSFPFPRIYWVVHSTDFQGLRLGLNTDLGQETRIVWSQKDPSSVQKLHDMTRGFHRPFLKCLNWTKLLFSQMLHRSLDAVVLYSCLHFLGRADNTHAVLNIIGLMCTRSHQSADFTFQKHHLWQSNSLSTYLLKSTLKRSQMIHFLRLWHARSCWGHPSVVSTTRGNNFSDPMISWNTLK